MDDRDSLELLTAHGANVNAMDRNGVTPLNIAVSDGQRLLTKRLMDLGADVNAPDNEGRTPLSIATAAGNRHIIEMLERFGARTEPDASTQ